MKEKVVLAYSGGLDTTAIIPWLKENFDYDVVCCCIDVGQGNELDGLDERAKLSGASKLYIENIVDEFCDDFVMPCVKAGAVYEHKYLLGTSMARPAIAKKLVEIARKENAVAICHGATGKGNDQIRFELGIKALAPDIKIIAPWRMTDVWTMQSREDEIAYCEQHGIHLPFAADSSYSRDRNLWHISHEGLELEDPANEPNYDHMLVLGVTPEKAPDQGEYVTMTFEAGIPKTLNGKEMKVSEIITELNALGGKHGIGIVDIVENRVVGMKSRGVYETPGGTILMAAHEQLEELILDRETLEAKKKLGSQFAQVVYEGKWFTPLREAIQAFVDVTQKDVTGEVKFKLYKGNIIKAGTTSPYSLYNESLASFTTGDLYDHHDASGFITLFGLPLKVRAMKKAELENKK
ncbi:MAG: argininosuccinate synthase [Lachnospiraceae bacterium]|nr:argininosuccinate synthase [Lachnospiraceae bacterium]